MRYSGFDLRQQVRDEYRELDASALCVFASVCDSEQKNVESKGFRFGNPCFSHPFACFYAPTAYRRLFKFVNLFPAELFRIELFTAVDK